MKTRILKAAFLVCILSVAQACAVMGAPSPKTFNERIAAGYISVTEVRRTATVLVQSNSISPDDAQNIQDSADKARTGLDLARTFGNTPQGEDKLATTLIILTGLQQYLNNRSPR
jgi:hypothetical protein